VMCVSRLLCIAQGDECSFSHVGEVQKKAELCKYYMKGVCTKKLDCAFYHDILFNTFCAIQFAVLWYP